MFTVVIIKDETTEGSLYSGRVVGDLYLVAERSSGGFSYVNLTQFVERMFERDISDSQYMFEIRSFRSYWPANIVIGVRKVLLARWISQDFWQASNPIHEANIMLLHEEYRIK